MNRSYRIIPIYTADVSGVCSALFELGGMVVMHDPSGCNSTYNTHDETRWYDHDSLIFISGLSEIDAILGNDDKFIDDVVTAARDLHPRFIALASAPIPYMNGTDFDGISRLIQAETGIPTFFVPTNGMHDYVTGAGRALKEIATRFVHAVDTPPIPHSVNLLGVTPLDFAAPNSVNALRNCLTQNGWQVLSCWAMGDTLDTLSQAGRASVNLVVSSVGLQAAQSLKSRFGTPYVVGAPIGQFTAPLLGALTHAEQTRESSVSYTHRATSPDADLIVIGEPVTMGSLAAAITLRYGVSVKVLCPLEQSATLLAPCDLLVLGEEETEAALKGAKAVLADPLYRPICDHTTKFYPLPHQAFSGRCFQRSMPNLFKLDL